MTTEDYQSSSAVLYAYPSTSHLCTRRYMPVVDSTHGHHYGHTFDAASGYGPVSVARYVLFQNMAEIADQWTSFQPNRRQWQGQCQTC